GVLCRLFGRGGARRARRQRAAAGRPRGGGARVTDFRRSLEALFPGRVQAGAPLAPYTTFRVGGPADWLIETRASAEVVAALRLAHAAGVLVTVLGGRSNVLVSDAGVRGLVLVTRGGAITVKGPDRLCADAAVTINGLVRWAVHRGYAGLEAW